MNITMQELQVLRNSNEDIVMHTHLHKGHNMTRRRTGSSSWAAVLLVLAGLSSALSCGCSDVPSQPTRAQKSASAAAVADGEAPMTVLTPSGPKTVRGEVYTPDVFGASVGLDELHDVLLGKDTGNRFKPEALFGESLPFAALCLVAQAADPSSVPIVAKLAAGPDKRMRTWAVEALGAMGERNASLRKPIEDAVKTTLRRTGGESPDWLAKAFRQPLLLHQDASGTVHVDGKPHDLDSVRKLLRDHVRKTGDDYVMTSSSPRTPDAAGNELNRLIQRETGIEIRPWEFCVLPEAVWKPIDLATSGAREDTLDTEPLPLSEYVLAAYRLDDPRLDNLGRAEHALLQTTCISGDGVRARIRRLHRHVPADQGVSYDGVRARIRSQNKSALEEMLGHVHVVRLVRHCLALEQEIGAKDPEDVPGSPRRGSAVLSAASTARKTMQFVLDEVDRLKGEGSPLITPAVGKRVETAEREMAALVEAEIKALRDAGRLEQARELEDRYRHSGEGARAAVTERTEERSAEPPSQAAIGVLKQFHMATVNLDVRQLEAVFLPPDDTSAGKNRRRHLEEARKDFAKLRDSGGQMSLEFEDIKQQPAEKGFVISTTIKDVADKDKPPLPVDIDVVQTDDGWKIAKMISHPAASEDAGKPGESSEPTAREPDEREEVTPTAGVRPAESVEAPASPPLSETYCGATLEWLATCPYIGIYTAETVTPDPTGHTWIGASLTKPLRGKPPERSGFDYPPFYDGESKTTFHPEKKERFLIFFRDAGENDIREEHIISLRQPNTKGWNRAAISPDFSVIRDGKLVEKIVRDRISKVAVTPVPSMKRPADRRRVEVPRDTPAFKALWDGENSVFLIVPEDLLTLTKKQEKK